MSRYEYECNECKEIFEVFLPFVDNEKAKIVCPKCKSERTNRLFSGINVNTKYSSKASPNSCCGDCGHCG